MQSDVIKRLVCENSFEEVISNLAGMTLQTLEKHLEELKRLDDEIENKLVVLGVSKETITQKRAELISLNKLPTFYSIAKLLENGM